MKCAIVLIFMLTAAAKTSSFGPRQIPVGDIWAYQLPGTRDIETLAGKVDAKLLDSIFESWHERAGRLKYKDMARPGFAVAGRDVAALVRAQAVFVKRAKPKKSFAAHEDVNLVFFSEIGGNRVHVKKVERTGSKIVISYWLEPYPGGGRRFLNLALIPMKRLPAGRYQVEMCQLPREEKYVKLGFTILDEEWSNAYLCRPFRFSVRENGKILKEARGRPP